MTIQPIPAAARTTAIVRVAPQAKVRPALRQSEPSLYIAARPVERPAWYPTVMIAAVRAYDQCRQMVSPPRPQTVNIVG